MATGDKSRSDQIQKIIIELPKLYIKVMGGGEFSKSLYDQLYLERSQRIYK